MGVFLMFEHVVLASESAEKPEGPAQCVTKRTTTISLEQDHKHHISLFLQRDVLTLLLSFGQAFKHVLFS